MPDYDPRTFHNLYVWYLVLMISGLVLAIVLVGFVLLLAGWIVGLVLLYKAWNQIQDDHQRVTPGLAVGLMFVPLFNLYWIFVLLHGLSVDMNRYCDRYGVETRRSNEGVVLACCILSVVSVVPYLGFLAMLPAFVLNLVAIGGLKRVASDIAYAHQNDPRFSAEGESLPSGGGDVSFP